MFHHCYCDLDLKKSRRQGFLILSEQLLICLLTHMSMCRPLCTQAFLCKNVTKQRMVLWYTYIAKPAKRYGNLLFKRLKDSEDHDSDCSNY